MIFMAFCSKFIGVCVYQFFSNKERFDKVIAKIKWCSFFSPHSVQQSPWPPHQSTADA